MDLTQIDPKKRALSLWDEFKAFAFKGNVIDLAVGVIVGGAFAKIVDSLVKNLIMPLVGVVLPGRHGYESWAITVRGKAIPYGRFLGDVIDFLLVAFVLYLFVVKVLPLISAYRRDQRPSLTKDQELLSEIRDLLRRRTPDGPEETPSG